MEGYAEEGYAEMGYAIEQGWANFSVQGAHSQILSFKGPHIR